MSQSGANPQPVPRICVDMDEVIADTATEHLRRYNHTFGEKITIDDLWGKGLWDAVGDHRHDDLRSLLDAEDFFEDLPVIADSQKVLRELSDSFEIFIATQAMSVPSSFGPKYRWLQRYFPFIPPAHYVFCGDKSVLRASYLIDDMPRNLLRFEGTGLLYSAPHNLAVDCAAQGFNRVNSWAEVAEFFQMVRAGEPARVNLRANL